MKIAILVPLFPPKWIGGTEIATHNIARHLAERKHDVHVITSLGEGLPKESIEQGFHVHRISQQTVKFLGVILFWVKIFWALKRINPDVIHIQSLGIGIPGVFAGKMLRKPYIVWGRGSEIYLPWRFKGVISKLVLSNAAIVIALTEDMKMEMAKVCNQDIIVIPNGIEPDSFQRLTRKEARDSLQIEGPGKIILFVGKLDPIKGVKYLIQAMAIIGQKETDTRLLLVGDGEQRDELKSLVAKLHLESQITFVGKVPNEKVPAYMATSDLFVLPSLSEGFPMAIIEAMASGLPIVTTRVRGLPEIVKDGQNGFVVEPEKPEEIAEKILLLLGDGKLREGISRNNKEKAKNHSWVTIAKRLEEVYLSCFNAQV